MYLKTAHLRSTATSTSPAHAYCSPAGPRPGLTRNSLSKRRGYASCPRSLRSTCTSIKASSSEASQDSKTRVWASASATAAAALLVLPAGATYAAPGSIVSTPYLDTQLSISYNISASNVQLAAVAAPQLTAPLIPATPFQAPGNPTPPAVADPKQRKPDVQDPSSGCSSSDSTQQQQQAPTGGPLDPPRPSNPFTPPPPHAPLPTPNQPHFPLLPTPPPPALPPQLLPPCNEPPPQKLLPHAAPGGLKAGDIKPVAWDPADAVGNSRTSMSEPVSAGFSPNSPSADVGDSPISLLKLYESEQHLQEQWQQTLMSTAFAEGSTAGSAIQEAPALPLPGDVPVPYYNKDLTQGEWDAVSAAAADVLYHGPGLAFAGSVPDSNSSAAVSAAYSTAEHGLLVAASFSDNPAVAAGSSATAAGAAGPGSVLGPATGLQQQQQQLSGPQLADDFPIQQVLEAVPATAHCPEAATAAPADCSSSNPGDKGNSSSKPGRFAASAAAATKLGSSSSTGQGSTGLPVTPLQAGGSSSGVNASTAPTAVPDDTRESAKAAKAIKQNIKSAREQIAARSRQLEYESPGYERLIDASKRLLVALIAIAQFLLKVALGVGVWLVKGLVQLIEWVLSKQG